jgi:hypothetical protein
MTEPLGAVQILAVASGREGRFEGRIAEESTSSKAPRSRTTTATCSPTDSLSEAVAALAYQ